MPLRAIVGFVVTASIVIHAISASPLWIELARKRRERRRIAAG